MKLLALVALAAAPFISYAQDTGFTAKANAAAIDARCQTDPLDPFDRGFVLTDESLSYKNQCINGARFRPIQNYSNQGTQATFANYMHQGRFWQARVPLAAESIEKVYFQVMKFPVVEGIIAAHAQIRFTFKSPAAVQLTGQGALGGEASSGDILISFEAGFPKDVNYNFARGGLNNYALVAKVMSTLQKHTESPTAIEQFELKLSAAEKAQLLSRLLGYASELGMRSFYNTLRPNCTTEVFDKIDELARFKGKFRPFMTVISADPIAGPSLKALMKRGLIEAQAPDFAAELEGQTASRPLPELPDPFAGFLPTVKGFPWSLVTVMPDTSTLSLDEKGALEDLRQQLILALPSLIQSYGSVLMLAGEGERGQRLFLNTLKEFVKRLPAALRAVNDRLPATAVPIRIYLAPHDGEATETSLVEAGIPADLPFSIADYRLTPDPKSASVPFAKIEDGLRRGGLTGVKSRPAFLMGTAILVRAQKDNSQVTTQLIAGLNPMTTPLQVNDPQVRLDRLVIPDSSKGGRQHPALIMTHVQDVAKEEVQERVDIELGSFESLGRATSRFGEGSLRTFGYFDDLALNPYQAYGVCGHVLRHVPVFDGVKTYPWFQNPIDDWVLQIHFYLTGMTMNLKTMTVEDMELLISFLPFSCMDFKSIEKDFAKAATATLQDQLKKSSDNPLFKTLGVLLQ